MVAMANGDEFVEARIWRGGWQRSGFHVWRRFGGRPSRIAKTANCMHHRRPSSGLLGPDGPDGRPPADARNNNKRQNQRTISPQPPPPPPPAATTLDEDSLHIPIQTNRIHLLLLSTHSLSSELESPFDVNTNIHGKCPLPTTTAKRPEWMESGCGDHGLGISTPKSWPCLI